MLEEHLSAGGNTGIGGSGSADGGSRVNRYTEHLETEREQLSCQLAHAREEHAAAAARLAGAQAAISKLQAVVQRLSAAGGGGGSGGGGGAGEMLGVPASPLGGYLAAGGMHPEEQQQQAQHSGLSSSSDAEGWQAEKRLLKAICKLALAVTMDQVGGRQEAASLADELAPLMAAHASALRQLGLHKVWASLHKLALAGGSGGRVAASTSTASARRAAHLGRQAHDLPALLVNAALVRPGQLVRGGRLAAPLIELIAAVCHTVPAAARLSRVDRAATLGRTVAFSKHVAIQTRPSTNFPGRGRWEHRRSP